MAIFRLNYLNQVQIAANTLSRNRAKSIIQRFPKNSPLGFLTPLEINPPVFPSVIAVPGIVFQISAAIGAIYHRFTPRYTGEHENMRHFSRNHQFRAFFLIR